MLNMFALRPIAVHFMKSMLLAETTTVLFKHRR